MRFKFNVALRPQRPHGILGTGSRPRTSTSTFTPFMSSENNEVQVQCCFRSTETIRTKGGGDDDDVELHVLGCRLTY